MVTGWDVMKAVYPAYKQSKLDKVVQAIKVPSFKKTKKKPACLEQIASYGFNNIKNIFKTERK